MAQQYEAKLANEYLAEKYWGKHYETRLWLGVPPMKEFRRMYQVTNRWADAIVFEPNKVTIIEFKMEPKPDGVGQLKQYEDMFRVTPRFEQYSKHSIYLKYVTTREDENLMALCKKQGIDYEVFRPKWIEDWERVRFRLP